MADDTMTAEMAQAEIWDAATAYALTKHHHAIEQRLRPAVNALIAAVRAEETAKRTLTDATVDAFLAAVDETDPERVERIRKLFNEKLSLGQAWVTKVTNEPDEP